MRYSTFSIMSRLLVAVGIVALVYAVYTIISPSDCVGTITQCHPELPKPGVYQLGPVGSDVWPLTR